jgi:radical SAM protein with 4Fe4S-binding SPASM domain
MKAAMELWDWAPQAPTIETVQQGEKWLVIAPGIPNWVVTTFAGVLAIGLCDGRTRIADLAQTMSQVCTRSSQSDVVAFFSHLREIGFFEPDLDDQGQSDPWPLAAVYLNVTETCNMQCPYCYMSSGPQAGSNELRGDEIADLLGQIHAINPEAQIVIAGGEPLVRRDIGAILDHISSFGFQATLITNGSIVKAELIPKLRTLTAVQISLDGSTADIHEKTRSNFDRVWDTIRLLKREKINVRISATISAFNYDDIGNLVEKCSAEGVELGFSYAQPMGRGKSNQELCVTPGKVFELMRNLSEGDTTKSTALRDTGLPGSLMRRHRRRMCGLGRSLISIAANGDVFPCHALHRQDLTMGNVRNHALPDILESPSVRRVRVPVEDINGCRDCTYRYLCGGGCRASSYWAENLVRSPYPGCELSRRTIEHNLFQGRLMPIEPLN